MPDRDPVSSTNLSRYGDAPLPWGRARAQMRKAGGFARGCFLGTSRPDGRPHAAGVGAIWHDGDVYFTSGPDARKSRNLASNPHCTLSVSLDDIDVVLEGAATRVVDAPTLELVAALYRDGGWPAAVAGDAFTAPFSAPSAGPPPWNLYRLRFHTGFGVATAAPNGATRWRFTPE